MLPIPRLALCNSDKMNFICDANGSFADLCDLYAPGCHIWGGELVNLVTRNEFLISTIQQQQHDYFIRKMDIQIKKEASEKSSRTLETSIYEADLN